MPGSHPHKPAYSRETAINEPEHEECCNCGLRRVKQAVEG